MSRSRNNLQKRLDPIRYYSELSAQKTGKTPEETEEMIQNINEDIENNTIKVMPDPDPKEYVPVVAAMFSDPSNDSTTENVAPPELLLNIPKPDSIEVVEQHNPDPKPENPIKDLNFTPFIVAGGVLILLSLIM